MHENQKSFGPTYNFLAYLECVRSYAWSKGYSDPDLSSVKSQLKQTTTHVHQLSFVVQQAKYVIDDNNLNACLNTKLDSSKDEIDVRIEYTTKIAAKK